MSPDHKDFPDEEHLLPCAEAMLAGTLALMTGHAQTCRAVSRQQMAAKIASNLAQLADHPLLTPAFRTVLGNLRSRWQALQDQGPDAAPEAQEGLWHQAAPLLQ